MKYLRKRKKEKLYQQWVDMANLPTDAIPRQDIAENRMTQMHKPERQQSNLPVLIILLVVAVLTLGTGLILLLTYPWG
ncbi:hypothetical protein ACFLYC_02635 [Chloroflexota bacterium]